jgi:hypothetical protein
MNLKYVNQNEKHIIDDFKVNNTPLPSNEFFEQFKADILKQVGEVSSDKKIIPLYKRWYSWTSIAAAIALIITLNWNRTETQLPNKQKIDFSSVSKAEILEYMEENIDDVDVSQLAEQLNEIPAIDVSEMVETPSNDLADQSNKSSEDLFENLDKDDILKYLQEEDLDIEEELFTGS